METTIDKAGRLVVPKALRDALAIGPGARLEIEARDGQLVVEPIPVEVHLQDEGDGPVAVPDRLLPPLTGEQVRDVLESVRR